jgi:hypothetical protein
MRYGADIVPKYFDAGYVLFNDAGSGFTIREANALDEEAKSRGIEPVCNLMYAARFD